MNEVTVQLTGEQWMRIHMVIRAEARQMGIIPKGAVSMGITNQWSDDIPSLVFDMEEQESCMDCEGCPECEG